MSHRKKSPRGNGSSKRRSRPAGPQEQRRDVAAQTALDPRVLIVGGLALLTASVWGYWPTLADTVGTWSRVPDYSHGFLVLPIAVFFLWCRRHSFPGDFVRPSILGVGLLLAAGALRVVGGLYFMKPLDGWSIPLWIAGSVWLLCGLRCLKWSLPAIVFLWFMFPIPWSAERWLSLPLQGIATKLSTASLLMLGQPALSEGHTILLGEHRLFVEEACSGLRIFIGIFALAFAFVLFSRWSWWQKVLALLAALPIAIVANVLRIVTTGLLYQFASSGVARHFSHDISGFLMIPLAAALFWGFLVYTDRMFPVVEEVVPSPLRPVTRGSH